LESNNYTKYSNKELHELLKAHDKFTFVAQLNLADEIDNRIFKIDISHKKQLLNEAIEQEKFNIKNLKYLNDLGFKYTKTDENYTSIKRTNRAISKDLLAILLGFCSILIIAFGLFIAIGVKGLQMFKSIYRLIDYLGFEFKTNKKKAILKKRLDLKLETVEGGTSFLRLEQISNEIILKFKNIIIAKASSKDVIQAMTITELYKKLKKTDNV